jgi:phosphoglycerate dehydrogenase-like enzyme
MKLEKIAVTSRSFSKHKVLRDELCQIYKNVTFNDEGLKLEGPSLITFLRGHEKAITALDKIDNDLLSKLPDLKVISKYGVGLDMIDQSAMKQNGVKFGWTAGVNKRSVSEMVISNAIAILRHIPQSNREILSGTWRQLKGGLLTNKTIGIIGCGNIGKDLVQLLQPFNCRIMVNDIVEYTDFYHKYSIQSVEIETLLKKSDIITLHVPLDESTRNFIHADRLKLIKKEAILINLARGGLVDEVILKQRLLNKKLAGAAFDVFEMEPPQDNELLHLDNFLSTGHIGGSAAEAILAMGRAAIEGLEINAIPNLNSK